MVPGTLTGARGIHWCCGFVRVLSLANPIHLHYMKPHPEPHYEQGRVEGLQLDSVDAFQFVNGVFRSRTEKIEICEAMGFTLR